jgi:predicted dehydrogenase
MGDQKLAPIGVGIIGLGGFGRFCLDAFSTTPGVFVAAVADTDAGRLDETAKTQGVTGYADVEKLIQAPAVQIVHLCTPPYLHALQGLAAFKAGKHLFCEKPLALTVEDGQQMIDDALAGRLQLSVNYVMRHNPFWQAAARIVRSGILGPLRHMSLMNHANGRGLAADHWFWDKRKSGGIWIEHGVHFFDAFAWVSGQRGEVLSSTSYQRADGAVDRVEALLQFGDVAAHCYHAFDMDGITEQTTVYLALEKGYLTLREWLPTSLEVVTTVEPAQWEPWLPGTLERVRINDAPFRTTAYAPEGKAALYQAAIKDGIQDLADAVRNPRHVLAVKGADGLESLRLAVQAELMSGTARPTTVLRR